MGNEIRKSLLAEMASADGPVQIRSVLARTVELIADGRITAEDADLLTRAARRANRRIPEPARAQQVIDRVARAAKTAGNANKAMARVEQRNMRKMSISLPKSQYRKIKGD